MYNARLQFCSVLFFALEQTVCALVVSYSERVTVAFYSTCFLFIKVVCLYCSYSFFFFFFSSFFLISQRGLASYHCPCFHLFFYRSGDWFIIVVLVFVCSFIDQETGSLSLSLFSFDFYRSGDWFIIVVLFSFRGRAAF